MKNATLLIIHTLGFGFVDLASQLLAYHHTDGVHTAGPLGGIGIVGCHVNAELCHALLPGNGVIGHGVVEHAVHIEKHGFGVKSLKAVFF